MRMACVNERRLQSRGLSRGPFVIPQSIEIVIETRDGRILEHKGVDAQDQYASEDAWKGGRCQPG